MIKKHHQPRKHDRKIFSLIPLRDAMNESGVSATQPSKIFDSNKACTMYVERKGRKCLTISFFPLPSKNAAEIGRPATGWRQKSIVI